MTSVETIKVKPWGDGQGDYVLINAADFDPKVHTRLDSGKSASKTAKPSKG